MGRFFQGCQEYSLSNFPQFLFCWVQAERGFSLWLWGGGCSCHLITPPHSLVSSFIAAQLLAATQAPAQPLTTSTFMFMSILASSLVWDWPSTTSTPQLLDELLSLQHLCPTFSFHQLRLRLWSHLCGRSERQRRKGKIHPSECRVPDYSKDR